MKSDHQCQCVHRSQSLLVRLLCPTRALFMEEPSAASYRCHLPWLRLYVGLETIAIDMSLRMEKRLHESV